MQNKLLVDKIKANPYLRPTEFRKHNLHVDEHNDDSNS